MTPYEVFFFSSGGVEEKWTEKDLGVMRANVFIGFPLGGLLSLAIAGCAATVYGPLDVDVAALSQVGLPIGVALGKIGIAVVIVGFVAATFGAACETGLSAGYSLAQFFGWQWGKMVRPDKAARFHLVLILATLLAVGILVTGVDPIMVTEMSVIFSAVALPLTYSVVAIPLLVITHMGAGV
jgi:Mn2+/Fe2+ NRAMP family transporter